MAWLFLPPEVLTQTVAGEACAGSHSARASADSTSACISPSPAIELFVTSSGTPMPRPLSWHGWKTRPWIARLSGTMLKPSTAKRGVAQWISSMAAIRASRSASPEKSSATKTRAISGRTSPASSAKSNRQSVSSKTLEDIYDWGLNKSTMTFDQWVTALRRACLQRQKSARPTNANDCSSWPTARVSSANEASRKEILAGNPKGRLEVSAQLWLTPRAQETTEKQDSFIKRNGDRTDRCFGSLTAQTTLWPTATATDSLVQRARPPEKMVRKDGRNVLRTPSLAETVLQPKGFPYTKQDLAKAKSGGRYQVARTQWPTPRAQEPGSTSSDHGISLTEASKAWPTPRACSGKRSSGMNRTELVDAWATPTTRDWKDGTATADVKTNCLLGRQAPRSMTNGSAFPLTLNPPFVEWLMGWPIGWTDCACVATGLSRWLQLMRSELSRLLQPAMNEQRDMFE
jgi:hypothetical protein